MNRRRLFEIVEVANPYDRLSKAFDLFIIALIIDSPGQYTVLDFGSISFNYANEKADDLIQGFQQGLIREIYAMQNVRIGPREKALPDYELDPRFRLEKIFEFQNFKDRITRVSRVLPP